MGIVGGIAAASVGLALGLYSGRLLHAIVLRWESTEAAVKGTRAAVGFLVGGAGGAVLLSLSGNSHVWYLLGLGFGMITAWRCNPGSRYSLQTFEDVVKLSDALQAVLPDPSQRALFILTPFLPPRAIERQENLDEAQLAERLETAADSVASDIMESDVQGADGEPMTNE